MISRINKSKINQRTRKTWFKEIGKVVPSLDVLDEQPLSIQSKGEILSRIDELHGSNFSVESRELDFSIIDDKRTSSIARTSLWKLLNVSLDSQNSIVVPRVNNLYDFGLTSRSYDKAIQDVKNRSVSKLARNLTRKAIKSNKISFKLATDVNSYIIGVSSALRKSGISSDEMIECLNWLKDNIDTNDPEIFFSRIQLVGGSLMLSLEIKLSHQVNMVSLYALYKERNYLVPLTEIKPLSVEELRHSVRSVRGISTYNSSSNIPVMVVKLKSRTFTVGAIWVSNTHHEHNFFLNTYGGNWGLRKPGVFNTYGRLRLFIEDSFGIDDYDDALTVFHILRVALNEVGSKADKYRSETSMFRSENKEALDMILSYFPLSEDRSHRLFNVIVKRDLELWGPHLLIVPAVTLTLNHSFTSISDYFKTRIQVQPIDLEIMQTLYRIYTVYQAGIYTISLEGKSGNIPVNFRSLQTQFTLSKNFRGRFSRKLLSIVRDFLEGKSWYLLSTDNYTNKAIEMIEELGFDVSIFTEPFWNWAIQDTVGNRSIENATDSYLRHDYLFLVFINLMVTYVICVPDHKLDYAIGDLYEYRDKETEKEEKENEL
jgi:hypothetical protein